MDINRVIIVVGKRGTGKTDHAKEGIMASKLPKTLIVDTIDSDTWKNMETYTHPEWKNKTVPVIEDHKRLNRWRSGVYRIFSKYPDEMLTSIDESSLKNVLILFEDATRYVHHRLQQSVKNLVYDSKQRNMDITFFFHSLAAVPVELIRISDYLLLHKTGDTKDAVRRYPIPGLIEKMEAINASKNPFERKLIALQG